MSNFKFLQTDPAFAPFMDMAIAAEKIVSWQHSRASTNWNC